MYLISALAEHSLSRGVLPFFDSMLPKTQVVPSIAAAWEFIFGMSFISSGSKHQRFAKISLSGKFI